MKGRHVAVAILALVLFAGLCASAEQSGHTRSGLGAAIERQLR